MNPPLGATVARKVTLGSDVIERSPVETSQFAKFLEPYHLVQLSKDLKLFANAPLSTLIS
jgi:hypothetical protein